MFLKIKSKKNVSYLKLRREIISICFEICIVIIFHNIWKLKDKGIPYEVKSSIKAKGHAFSRGGRAHNPNGRPKHNVEHKRRIARNL